MELYDGWDALGGKLDEAFEAYWGRNVSFRAWRGADFEAALIGKVEVVPGMQARVVRRALERYEHVELEIDESEGASYYGGKAGFREAFEPFLRGAFPPDTRGCVSWRCHTPPPESSSQVGESWMGRLDRGDVVLRGGEFPLIDWYGVEQKAFYVGFSTVVFRRVGP